MLQLVLDANGNYTYKNVSGTSNNITSKDFEAYQGTQKTKLASDTTNIGTQTETLLRERPGTITTTTDPKTGEVKTTGGAQQIGIQSDMPTGTGTTTTPINPITTAIHRFTPTLSSKKIGDNAVVTRGATKASVKALAIDIIEIE